jgi:hypothetical protein
LDIFFFKLAVVAVIVLVQVPEVVLLVAFSVDAAAIVTFVDTIAAPFSGLCRILFPNVLLSGFCFSIHLDLMT